MILGIIIGIVVSIIVGAGLLMWWFKDFWPG